MGKEMSIDIYQHFLVGMLLYISCKYVFTLRATLGIILVVALGKEVWDYFNYGFYPLENIKDIFFTMLYPTLGILIRKVKET